MQYFIQELSDFDDSRIQACLEWFPSAQAEAIRQIANPSRRREKTAAYSLLIEAMKSMALYRELPIVEYAENGKPYLKNYPHLFFNLSHCNRYVAVGVNQDSPVGIDVECRRKVSPSLIKRVCSDEEQHIISQSSDPDLEFLRLWTRKEAYLKYTGTGIVEPLTNIPPQSTVHCPLTTDYRSQVTGHLIETHPLPEGDGWVSVCWEAEIVT